MSKVWPSNGVVKVNSPKCADCGGVGQITWDGVWLCKDCEAVRMRCKNFNCKNPSGKVDIQTRKEGTKFWECPDCGCIGDL